MAGKNTAAFGIYRDEASVRNVVETLQKQGFRSTDISVLFRCVTLNRSSSVLALSLRRGTWPLIFFGDRLIENRPKSPSSVCKRDPSSSLDNLTSQSPSQRLLLVLDQRSSTFEDL